MPYRPLTAPVNSGQMGTVYLIHLNESFGHAQHYMGWASELDHRLWHHSNGTGARFMRHVRAAGITWRLAQTWQGDRNLERQLKNRGGKAKLCPICKGKEQP